MFLDCCVSLFDFCFTGIVTFIACRFCANVKNKKLYISNSLLSHSISYLFELESDTSVLSSVESEEESDASMLSDADDLSPSSDKSSSPVIVDCDDVPDDVTVSAN